MDCGLSGVWTVDCWLITVNCVDYEVWSVAVDYFDRWQDFWGQIGTMTSWFCFGRHFGIIFFFPVFFFYCDFFCDIFLVVPVPRLSFIVFVCRCSLPPAVSATFLFFIVCVFDFFSSYISVLFVAFYLLFVLMISRSPFLLAVYFFPFLFLFVTHCRFLFYFLHVCLHVCLFVYLLTCCLWHANIKKKCGVIFLFSFFLLVGFCGSVFVRVCVLLACLPWRAAAPHPPAPHSY